MILFVRKDEEEEHFLSTSKRDDPDTRLGFLKFLEVLFHHCKCCQNHQLFERMTL